MILEIVVTAGVVTAVAGGLGRLGRSRAEADWGGPWLNRLDGLNRLFCRYYHGLSAEPIPLPDKGGAIVVANHVSGLDPFLLAAACRRPLRFMIAREQYQRWWLKWFFDATGCIPVDRKVRAEQALRLAAAALRAGEVVALFPHGHIQRHDDPAHPIKAGAVRLSSYTDSPIYPNRVEGVTAKGFVILGVLIPSRARIHSFAPLVCGATELEICLEQLACILNKAVEPERET